jgi:lipoprotein-anchoring transpeptidase ErfK/SrfK
MEVHGTSRALARAKVAATLALFLLSCSSKRDASVAQPPANLHVEANGILGARLTPSALSVAVPPADGPKLAALLMAVPVRARPDRTSETVGQLRVGSRVSRSERNVSVRDCPGGWYVIRPVGFVCAGTEATTELQHPVARAINTEPNRSRPMPYRYGFLRAIAPNYLKVPSKDEQLKYEMRLERHLRNWKKLGSVWDTVDVGANDVSLDLEGLAVGEIPKSPVTMSANERFGSSGDDHVPWWLVPQRQIPNLSGFRAPSYAVIADRAKRHAGVALIGEFVAPEQSQSRRFAITTDARLIPADKIKATSGSPFHGQDIRKLGLPAAFVRADNAHYVSLLNGKVERGEPLAFRQFVPLSGKVEEFRGHRMVQTRDGQWLESSDLWVAASPSTMPAFAAKNNHWIDVAIINQMLVLWEGQRPVYMTLVSTGRDGLGDPQTTRSTPQGTFRIYQKHVTTTMDSDVADEEFELRDVPWVMYFKGGYALHGAYWHDEFGRARSHGCINLAPIDARYVFQWATPQVPEHWHAVTAGGVFEEGTLVNIHP